MNPTETLASLEHLNKALTDCLATSKAIHTTLASLAEHLARAGHVGTRTQFSVTPVPGDEWIPAWKRE